MLRHLEVSNLTEADVGDIIDYLCSVAVRQDIFFLWRPVLRDTGDDLVLELAVAGECDAIITHNLRDFGEAKQFELQVLSPRAFLDHLRGTE